VNGTTAIDLGGGDFIVINGIAEASFHAGDFILTAGSAATAPAQAVSAFAAMNSHIEATDLTLFG
jgi:hypothetical protein